MWGERINGLLLPQVSAWRMKLSWTRFGGSASMSTRELRQVQRKIHGALEKNRMLMDQAVDAKFEELAPSTCVVCQEAVAEMVLVPCGHLAMCTECSMRVLRGPRPICVVCRQPIEKAPPLVTSPHTRACMCTCVRMCICVRVPLCPCTRPPSVTFCAPSAPRVAHGVSRLGAARRSLQGAPCHSQGRYRVL